jgi:hypothetical protein
MIQRMANFPVSNGTLYSLLQTIHANQTKYDIPELAAILAEIAPGFAALRAEFDSKFAVLDAKLAIMDAKLDKIIVQITPPETGDFNP